MHALQAVQNVELERKAASEQQLQQKQARNAELRDAHLRQIRRKALNETTKVHEVLFINKLQKEDKELTLMQRMQVQHPHVCRHWPRTHPIYSSPQCEPGYGQRPLHAKVSAIVVDMLETGRNSDEPLCSAPFM